MEAGLTPAEVEAACLKAIAQLEAEKEAADDAAIVAPAAKPITKGCTVKYIPNGNRFRVSAVFKTKNTANLAGWISGKVIHRGVPLTDLVEDGDAAYEAWTKSEAYQCM